MVNEKYKSENYNTDLLPRVFEMVDDEILLSPSDIASLIGVHVETVRRWCRNEKLRTISPMGRYMIRGDDLKNFLLRWYNLKFHN